mmetsp:Transcript_30853/g.49466  ORF Transcript_30853/g.49466 Transcript_30853/m.49466 type:complete len:342 (-) Transcript_30853:58-1083(-)
MMLSHSLRAARRAGVRHVSTQAVVYERLGNPTNVLKESDVEIGGGGLRADEGLVQMIAAPVDRFDLSAVAGAVAGVPATGIAGNQGVGVVNAVGSAVTALSKGDRVVPIVPGVGTWSKFAVAHASSVAAVPKGINDEQAALLGNGATALRVLGDAGLKNGDTVIHDGAAGPAGLAFVQVAKAKGLKTISIVDENAVDYKNVSKALKAAGSQAVIHESMASSDSFRKVCADLKPKLAVHSSSSKGSSAELARALGDGGVLVSVSGAGPVVVPSSVLIEKGVTVRGFNLAKELASTSGETIKELEKLIKDGKLTQPAATKVPLSNFDDAIKQAATGASVLFTM